MAAKPSESKDIFRLFGMLYADEEIVAKEFIEKWLYAYPEDAQWVKEFRERWDKAYPEGRWKWKPTEKDA